jgi:hypothetical protein
MKGLKILLSKNDTVIDLNNSVTGFDATVQNALVNIATQAGSDKIYSDKGTNLLKHAVTGKIVGFNDANHEAQIAALATLFFSRDQDTGAPSTERLGSIAMSPVTYTEGTLTISAAFTDLEGSRTLGTTTIL